MPLWHMCTTFAVGTPPAQLMSPRQFCTIMDAVGMYVLSCECPLRARHSLFLFWYLGNHVLMSFGVAYALRCLMRVYNDANWSARACFAPSACNCVTLCRMPAWSVHRALDRVFATKSRFCFPYPPQPSSISSSGARLTHIIMPNHNHRHPTPTPATLICKPSKPTQTLNPNPEPHPRLCNTQF